MVQEHTALAQPEDTAMDTFYAADRFLLVTFILSTVQWVSLPAITPPFLNFTLIEISQQKQKWFCRLISCFGGQCLPSLFIELEADMLETKLIWPIIKTDLCAFHGSKDHFLLYVLEITMSETTRGLGFANTKCSQWRPVLGPWTLDKEVALTGPLH